MTRREVPYLLTSIDGAVSYIAASLLPRGYWFVKEGRIPPEKDPLRIDRKLIDRYGCNPTKWRRGKQRLHGIANLRYLRYEDTWWIFATKGRSPFFQAEQPRNLRRSPMRFAGYSISVKQGGWLRKKHPDEKPVRDTKLRAHVRIDEMQYREIRGYLLSVCTHRSAEWLEREIYRLPFRPFGPVVEQIDRIRKQVSHKRLRACLPVLSRGCVNLWKEPVKPFGQ